MRRNQIPARPRKTYPTYMRASTSEHPVAVTVPSSATARVALAQCSESPG